MPDDKPPDRTQVQVGGPTVTAASALGFPTIPGYEIVGELGRGGMGVVYEAKQTKLNRVVALKLMKDDDPLNKARFLAEGQVIAAVKHPHVVEVYDFGESIVGPFIAMEYLTGGSLSDGLREATPRTVADLLAKVAAGVGAAHDQGVVHRDLKPGNVLLAADGTPKVTDFGLAKRATSELTQTQDAAGTPAYMAPEQARAMKFVGPPADVWSLGVMLYEALAGKKPFTADTDMELLIRIQNDTPTTLRALTKGIPPDLETVCLKCLEKEPERRYATANDLAADLTAWLAGRPIAARRATTLERVVLWVRRKPMTAAAWAFGTLAAVLAVSVAATTTLWREAVGERATAVTARETAETAQGRAETAEAAEKKAKDDIAAERERLAYARSVFLAHAAYQDNDVRRAEEFLAACPETLRGWDWRYVHRLCHSDLYTLKVADGILKVAPNADGTRVAVGGYRTASGLWDTTTNQLAFPFKGFGDGVRRVAFNADGTRVVAASDHYSVAVWDARTGEQEFKSTITDSPLHLWFDGSDVRCLSVSGAHANQVMLRDAKTGAVIHTFAHGTKLSANTFTSGNVTGAAVSADGGRILTGSVDRTARLWDARTGKEVQVFRGHTESVEGVAMTPDATRVATASSDGTVRVWDAKTGAAGATIKARLSFLKPLAISPDGTRVATGGDDKSVHVWDATTGAEVIEFRGHTVDAVSVAFVAGGTRLVSAAGNGTVKAWDLTRANEPRLTRAGGRTLAVAFSPAGGRVLLFDGSGAQLLDPATGTVPLKFKDAANLGLVQAWGAAFNRDGTRLMTQSDSDTVRVWDAKTGDSLFSLEDKGRRGKGVTSAAISADGTRVATAAGYQYGDGDDFTATVWDVTSGAELRTCRGHTADVLGVAMSPDGTRVVTSSKDNTLRVWDAATGEQRHTLPQPLARSLAFDETGARLAAAGEDGALRVWDTTTWAHGPLFRGHSAFITSVAFTPDGGRIVTGSYDKTTKVWDAKTGSEILTLPSGREVYSVAVSPDGTQLAVTTGDVRIYDSRPVTRASLPTRDGKK